MKRMQYIVAATVSLAVVVGMAVLPVCAQARISTRLSSSASAGTARVYRSLTLSGRLTTVSGRSLSRRSVRLESRPAGGGKWSLVGRKFTSRTGRLSWQVKPQRDTSYRFRYNGSRTLRPASSTARKIVGHHFALRFQDNFSGASVDTTTWSQTMWWPGGTHTTGQLQTYTTDALQVRDGKLIITATEASSANSRSPYDSGVVSAHGPNQFHFKYGYIETRVKMPKGMGLWPAVWLFPLDHEQDSEMDVFEARGQLPCRNDMTLHFGDTQVKKTYTGSDLTTSFHTFAINWTADHVIWYRDGIERYRVTDPAKIPDDVMYLIANLQLGDWGGIPDASTQFPANFYVDYIRVYQHE